MAVEVSGVVAALRWGYHEAATLGPWTARKDGAGWRLEARVGSVHTFRVTRRPLVFEARHATGAWRWPVIELQVQADALTAQLGPLEG